MNTRRQKWVLGKGDHDFRAVATPGMEGIVADELRALGVQVTGQDSGGVQFRSGLLDAMTVNLRASTVERVWARAAEFRAKTFGELFHKTRRLDWSRVLAPEGGLHVVAACHRSRLMHTGRVTDTIADALGGHVTDDASGQGFLARIVDDRCTLSVDMSGARLHMRGYREHGMAAPIRETRAAALLRWSGWSPGDPVYDPCCGSGTFLVEAGRMAAGIPPGCDRTFAFESWPKYDAAGFRRARTQAQRDPIETSLTGIDASELAAAAAQVNSVRAGVHFDLVKSRFQDATSRPSSGLLIANPPYGKRIGTDLIQTWEALGALFSEATFCTRVLLSPNPMLYAAFQRSFVGPDPADSLEFSHGGLKVRAFRWAPSPTS